MAREVSTAAVPGGPPAPTGLDVSGGRPASDGRPAAGGQQDRWRGSGEPGVGALRAGTARVGGPGVSTERASVLRASAVRVGGPGISAHRVRVQRASIGRVSVRAAASAPGGLRLTRRGRRVLTGLVMLAAIVTAMLIWTSVAGGAQVPGAGSPARSPYQGMAQIVVRPGQTLWSVAVAAEPSADPWTVIQQISDVNALNGAQIQAGQLLWVPRG